MNTLQITNRLKELRELDKALKAIPNEDKSIADLARHGRILTEISKLTIAIF